MDNWLDPDDLIVCPYDPVHMVARKRMQYHLIKCRKNHNPRDFKTCPFNARHIIPKPEYDYHIHECADRAKLDAEVLQKQRSKDVYFLKGNTDVPISDWQVPDGDENWDDDNVVYVPPLLDGLQMDALDNRKTNPPPPSQERSAPPPSRPVVEEPLQPRMPNLAGMESRVYQYSLAQTMEASQPVRIQPAWNYPGLGRGRGRRLHAAVGLPESRPPPGLIGRGAPPPGLVHPASQTMEPVMLHPQGLQAHIPFQSQQSPFQSQQTPFQPQQSPFQSQQSPFQPQQSPFQPQQSPFQPQQGPPPLLQNGQLQPAGEMQQMPSGAVGQPTIQTLNEEEITKRNRKLRKMLRQIEHLEAKQQGGDHLDPEQVAKLDRKQDILDLLASLEISATKLVE